MQAAAQAFAHCRMAMTAVSLTLGGATPTLGLSNAGWVAALCPWHVPGLCVHLLHWNVPYAASCQHQIQCLACLIANAAQWGIHTLHHLVFEQLACVVKTNRKANVIGSGLWLASRSAATMCQKLPSSDSRMQTVLAAKPHPHMLGTS